MVAQFEQRSAAQNSSAKSCRDLKSVTELESIDIAASSKLDVKEATETHTYRRIRLHPSRVLEISGISEWMQRITTHLSMSGVPGTGKSTIARAFLAITGGAREEIIPLSIHHKDVVSNWRHGITKFGFGDFRMSKHVATSKRHAFRELSCFVLIASVSAAVLSSWNSMNNNAYERFEQPLLLFAMKPSLAEFLLSMITYATAVVIYAQIRCNDRWQGRILSTALLGSTMLGISLTCDLQTTILGIVTWTTVIFLALSTIFHELLSMFGRDRQQCWFDSKIDEVEKTEHI